ncbi:hypothetical protein AALP_AAs42616U000100 [Arabis alpina]|nr:hypothetical protein AALP_AAs42616U000100 [Arabis alpina]
MGFDELGDRRLEAVGDGGTVEPAPASIPVSPANDPTSVSPTSSGRTEVIGVSMALAGPTSRRDAEVIGVPRGSGPMSRGDATEVIGVPRDSGPMSRGDATEVMASGTHRPDSDGPPYARLDPDGLTPSLTTDDPTATVCTDEPKSLTCDGGTDEFLRNRAPTWVEGIELGVDGLEASHGNDTEVADEMFPLNDEDPDLPPGNAFVSSSSSSSGSRTSDDESDDENTLGEVEQPKKAKKAKKKARAKVCPDPPG